ncbi:MAG TPA: chorismate mutase [Gemmatimonadaceae bacterium]|jgi:chorismate mutase|nr:chorismate mutase [Gemmatimonadaceae bacterium]
MSLADERHFGALRGATTIEHDDPAHVRDATRELLERMVATNNIAVADIISVVFTVSRDITSEFPARAARDLGWVDVPLLCATEIPVPGAVAHCIRVLIHLESTRPRNELRPVYLRGAAHLRD